MVWPTTASSSVESVSRSTWSRRRVENQAVAQRTAAIVLAVPDTQESGAAVQGAGSTALVAASAIPEVRRLLVALVWTAPVQAGFVLAWSRWRRRHQARARRAHYHRRERQVWLEH
jgi:hypothetical protein